VFSIELFYKISEKAKMSYCEDTGLYNPVFSRVYFEDINVAIDGKTFLDSTLSILAHLLKIELDYITPISRKEYIANSEDYDYVGVSNEGIINKE
jgi:hypothetical protein